VAIKTNAAVLTITAAEPVTSQVYANSRMVVGRGLDHGASWQTNVSFEHIGKCVSGSPNEKRGRKKSIILATKPTRSLSVRSWADVLATGFWWIATHYVSQRTV